MILYHVIIYPLQDTRQAKLTNHLGVFYFFGASLDLIFWTSLVPTWKVWVRTWSGTDGVAANKVVAMDCVPGSWLLKAEITEAETLALFFWKWSKPFGNTNMSPLLMVFDMSTLDVVMNPTSSWPSRTNTISVARGWVWGGFMPPGA